MTQKRGKITLVFGGPGGSGSTTIAKMFSKHFNIPHIYAGDLFRKRAKKEDIENFEEFLQVISKGGNTLDLEIDKVMEEYAKKGNVVLDSKIFGALAKERGINCTATIWLDAKLGVRVKRHLGREDVKGIERVLRRIAICFNLKKRHRIDKEKYKRLYSIKYSNPSLYYDIVMDTSNMDVQETFNLILKKLKDGKYL